MDLLSGLVLAKQHSKRLPEKNTLDFHGEPMFLVNVKKCLSIFDEVYVSSDSPLILEEAERAGAIAIERPFGLCGDTPNIPVYQHAMEQMKCDGFAAVQANSPTVDKNLIALAKKLLMIGAQEIMTCHPDYKIYGSVWAMTAERLKNYGDPYRPTPEVLLLDGSVDIHTQEDYESALLEYNNTIKVHV